MAFSSSPSEKVTFGAVIDPSGNQHQIHDDSSMLTPTSMSSPFYDLPSAQPSIQSLPSNKEPEATVYEADLEAGGRQGVLNLTPLTSSSRLDLPPVQQTPSYATTVMSGFKKNKECTVWPTKETLREKAKAQKAMDHQRHCCGSIRTKWANLTHKQRVWTRVVVLLLIIALAVGLGVGISRAVDGGVYAGSGQTTAIPGTHS